MEDSSEYTDSGPTVIKGAHDYSTSAHRELLIREQTAGLVCSLTHVPDAIYHATAWRLHCLRHCQVKTAQDISTLIRDLQELWLFGGLDTLWNPADEEANRTKALAVAEMIEALAKRPAVEATDKDEDTEKENGDK